MNENSKIYVNALGIINALGSNKQEVLSNLLAGYSPGMRDYNSEILGETFYCGCVDHDLPIIPSKLSRYNCRNNQLALSAIKQIEREIHLVISRYSKKRVGIVMGTSTSGIFEAERALNKKLKTGILPKDYDYKMQEFGTLSEFLSKYLDISGPSYVISTACSSSGKVFASAKRLLENDICDAVIVGGCDTLCDLTLGGFGSLEAISSEQSIPFSQNRKGINIGEGAAVFLLSKCSMSYFTAESKSKLEKCVDVQLLGVGETSDAHHMSAPEPEGKGAIEAMKDALTEANISANEIDYINLHGTGTKLNDSMEAFAVNKIFGINTRCSSTKPLTGHTLGAAGATELGICWMLLKEREQLVVAPHIYDKQYDHVLKEIRLASKDEKVNKMNITMSNSFAFGGNNVSVIFAVDDYKSDLTNSNLTDDSLVNDNQLNDKFSIDDHPIETLIPHSSPMVLLDKIVDFDDDRLVAELTIRIESKFYDSEVKGVPSWVGLEYMSQAIAALAGIHAKKENREIKLGFLLGTRKYNIVQKTLKVDRTYLVDISELYKDESGLASFECKILEKSVNNSQEKHQKQEQTLKLVATTKLNVFETDDFTNMLK